jgi:4-carboxymuconolactone decarboxylase
MTDNKRPVDVFEDSGSRLPLPNREDLDGAALKIFDKLMDPAGGSLVGLKGPGGIRLHSPKASEAAQPFQAYFRGGEPFDGQILEISILITARELNNQFEWAAHEKAARKVGISQDVIDIVKFRKPIDGASETQAAIIQFGRELFRDWRVTPDTFAIALKLFGARQLVDIVSLMGQYAATAVLLTSFDIQLHDGEQNILPLS